MAKKAQVFFDKSAVSYTHLEKLCEAMISIGPASIHVDATPGITVSGVRSKARRLQLEHGLDVIMICLLYTSRCV